MGGIISNCILREVDKSMVIGYSGAGKSTLVRCLNLEIPNSGTVERPRRVWKGKRQKQGSLRYVSQAKRVRSDPVE